MFQFHRDRLKEKIGKGRFGSVFAYQKDFNDSKWVVKRITAEDADSFLSCLPEIVLGFTCDHPCTVPIKGYFIEKASNNEAFTVYMKLPRMKGTLLNDFTTRKTSKNAYKEDEIVRHFYSLTCGLEHLHNKKIYHGDIKPDNLLLDENGSLRIADVGIAKHVSDEDLYQIFSGQKGTCRYSAPEVMEEDGVTKARLPKADIWSLGVVILELCLFGERLPLNALSPRDQIQKTIGELMENIKGKFQDSLTMLLKRILSLDPKERPGIEDIRDELEKNFFHILDKKLLELGKNMKKRFEDEIALLNQQIQGISQRYLVENKKLEENIFQLQQKLTQQEQIYEDKIKAWENQNKNLQEELFQQQNFNKILQEKIIDFEEELNGLRSESQRQLKVIHFQQKLLTSSEEQIEKLRQERVSSEQSYNLDNETRVSSLPREQT